MYICAYSSRLGARLLLSAKPQFEKQGGEMRLLHPSKHLLLSQTKLLDQRTIALKISLLQISQETTSLTDHLQHTTSGMMIFLVNL
jgi:hypothetical protein